MPTNPGQKSVWNSSSLPKPDKNGKEQKPFADKVLNKALEYLRGEIKKVRAALAVVPEVANG